MKLQSAILGVVTILALSLVLFAPAAAMDDPGFVITRMVISKNIVDKEPVAVSDTFSADTEKIYCFLEAGNIEKDTTVSFVWYYQDREMARVSLPLRKGMRWRTYASKKLAGLKGNWKVELEEATGIVLNSVTFQVQ